MGNRVAKQVEELRTLLEQRLRIRGRDLAHQTKKAGRLLPQRIRRDLGYVDQASNLLTHPKLYKMVDEGRVLAAARRVAAYLREVDPTERRKDRWLGIAGVVSFNLIIVFGLIVGVLLWRGMI